MTEQFTFKPAKRSESRLNLAVDGPSGAGKTVGALRVAYGITGDWGKVFVIDTEKGSASLYQGDKRWNIGPFMHLNLDKPYHPDRYIKAIESAIRAGAEVVIIDQISHAWSGTGGVLDIKEQAEKSSRYNSYTAWSVATPLHNRLIETLLTSPVHMISVMRSKMEYAMVTEGNKTKIKRVGLAPVQRNDIEYEWTALLDIDRETHTARVGKSRTAALEDGIEYELSEELGQTMLKWLESADGYKPIGDTSGYTAPSGSGGEPAPKPAARMPQMPTRPEPEQTQEPKPAAKKPAAEPDDKADDERPWADETLSITGARNIVYMLAVGEWGFESVDQVRATILAANKWEKIDSTDTLDEIAQYLQKQGAGAQEA